MESDSANNPAVPLPNIRDDAIARFLNDPGVVEIVNQLFQDRQGGPAPLWWTG
jgi:hypothetical protein